MRTILVSAFESLFRPAKVGWTACLLSSRGCAKSVTSFTSREEQLLPLSDSLVVPFYCAQNFKAVARENTHFCASI